MNEIEVIEERRTILAPTSINQGAVAIEQERAIAEAQGQLTLAKRFPRDLNSSHAELMTACKSKAFAEVAFYSVPNRGSGPSIRLAEEIARVYGNFQYGHRELGREEGKSEIEVFAWDMEKNNRSIRQITVMHVMDTKNGPKTLKDQADIDNKIANVASKQVRGRILALMPKWLVQDAVVECRKTLAGNNSEPLETRIRRMIQAFGGLGVTVKVIEAWLGKPTAELTPDEIVDLTGMYNAVKEGANASEVFAIEGEVVDADAKPRVRAADRLKAQKPKAEAQNWEDARSELPKDMQDRLNEKRDGQHKPVKAEPTEPKVEDAQEYVDDQGEVHDGGEPEIDDSLAATQVKRTNDEF